MVGSSTKDHDQVWALLFMIIPPTVFVLSRAFPTLVIIEDGVPHGSRGSFYSQLSLH